MGWGGARKTELRDGAAPRIGVEWRPHERFPVVIWPMGKAVLAGWLVLPIAPREGDSIRAHHHRRLAVAVLHVFHTGSPDRGLVASPDSLAAPLTTRFGSASALFQRTARTPRWMSLTGLNRISGRRF